MTSWIFGYDCGSIQKNGYKSFPCDFSIFNQVICESRVGALHNYNLSQYDVLNTPNFKECPKNTFLCKPELICISLMNVCNQRIDCPSGNDELNCKDINTFICDSGEEINTNLICNYIPDCKDASDERNCQKTCTRVKNFQCKNGQCIDSVKVCNREKNCIDGSDEQCTDICESTYCDGRCLREDEFCDLRMMCKGFPPQDENPDICVSKIFQTETTKQKRDLCKMEDIRYLLSKLHTSSQDYNKTNCRLEYDTTGFLRTKTQFPFQQLENCVNQKCDLYSYKCKFKGYCIPLSLICDGIVHCIHGDDEENCGRY
ncbi:DgyrCDS3240 [Dimorphilus gyrociliatus]|uniref:DgyrCDS3240 n=1 Tax=Dimorphilus gyrociliatus TaxID=2664684 RepID=A0A7I8VCL5_9ANNE|nr:DgyrCDS3240 [Dimorphilus gyrociliatus]